MTERSSKALAGDRPAADAGASGTIAFDDVALVDRSKNGDMQAFAALVAKYQDRIFNTILRMCGQRADAEELAQETFLRALERLGQFRGHSRFYPGLFRIAANLTISHRRRTGRIAFHSLAADDGDGSQADGLTAAIAARRNPGPEAMAMAADAKRRVLEALEALDEEHRLVVILRDMEDMDYAEIAEVLNLPMGTVKSRLHRGRCAMKDKLMDLVG